MRNQLCIAALIVSIVALDATDMTEFIQRSRDEVAIASINVEFLGWMMTDCSCCCMSISQQWDMRLISLKNVPIHCVIGSYANLKQLALPGAYWMH